MAFRVQEVHVSNAKSGSKTSPGRGVTGVVFCLGAAIFFDQVLLGCSFYHFCCYRRMLTARSEHVALFPHLVFP